MSLKNRSKSSKKYLTAEKIKPSRQIFNNRMMVKQQTNSIRQFESKHPLKNVFQKTYQSINRNNYQNVFENDNIYDSGSSDDDTYVKSRRIITRIKSRVMHRKESMPNL